MENKNKKGGLKTAQVETVNTTIETTVEQVKANNSTTTMDRNHQVDMLKIMHETFHPTHDPDAAAHTGFSQETVDKMNRLKALGIAVVFGQEVAFGNSDFAMILRKADLPELKEAMVEIGMKLDETKLLTASDNNDDVQIPSTAVEVSEETKEQLKKDADAVKATEGKVYDPTKIKNEDELKEALAGILAVSRDEKLIDSIYKTISFWLAYQKVTANKAGDKARTQELNSMSNADIFQEVVKLTGRTGMLCYGLANHIFLQTACTGSPISAWCCLYSSSINKETGICKHSNEELADIIKCLVKYEANNIRAKALATIEEESKLPEKDRTQAHIDTANKNIAFADKAMQAIVCAPSEFVANLKQNYLEKDNAAHKTVICIKKAFYNNVPVDKMMTVKIDSLLDNCTQYAAMISNLFRDPGNLLEVNLEKVDHLEYKTAEEISAENAAVEKEAAEKAEQKAKEDEAKKAAGLKKKAKEEKKKQVKK